MVLHHIGNITQLSANHKNLGKKYLDMLHTMLIAKDSLYSMLMSLSNTVLRALYLTSTSYDVLPWKPDVQKGVAKLTTQCLHGLRNNHLISAESSNQATEQDDL